MPAPVAPVPMDIMGDIALPEPVPVPADPAMLLGRVRLPDAPASPEQIAF